MTRVSYHDMVWQSMIRLDITNLAYLACHDMSLRSMTWHHDTHLTFQSELFGQALVV